MTDPYDMSMEGLNLRFSPARIFDSASFPSGGAGLAGTARDYLRFAEALRLGGAPVLSPATARAMRENQLGDIAAPLLGPGAQFGLGVGIVVDPAAAKSPKGRGSFGWSGIYGTDFWVDPSARMSVVILTNVAGDSPLGMDLQNAIYAVGP
jgi:CubicO group peptidase (beta-lactamase class C family)